MQKSSTRSHQRSLLSKYKIRISRLQKAIQEGNFSRYTADKKRQLFQCLARYERRLQQWGIAVATGTLLLLPANKVSAQTPLPVGNEFQVNTYTNSDQFGPSVAMDSDGDFVISWTSNVQDWSSSGIYAQRYDNTGVSQGSEFQVNTYTTLFQTACSVAMDNAGDFVISWHSYLQDGSHYGIYAQRYMFPAPLPIELLFFTGHEEISANILEWATATEKNSAWQIIERSPNVSEDWTEVGKVAGAGTSTTPVSYKISDDNPLPLGYYRIRAIDFNGSEQFSEVISLSRTATALSILNVFPVPVEKEASILVNLPASGAVKVSVYNTLGQLVHQSSANLSKGVQEVKIEMGNMSSGLYAVTIEDGMTRVKQQVVKM